VISLNSQFLLGVAHVISYATSCTPRANSECITITTQYADHVTLLTA